MQQEVKFSMIAKKKTTHANKTFTLKRQTHAISVITVFVCGSICLVFWKKQAKHHDRYQIAYSS